MAITEISRRTVPEQATAVVRATLATAEIPAFFDRVYGQVATLLGAAGAGPAGPPFARYHRLGDDRFEVEAGFPATGPFAEGDGVEASSLPGGEVAWATYLGPYDAMAPAYAEVAAWITAQGAEVGGDGWEIYQSDPSAEPDPARWRTDILTPLRG